jgi:alkylated DNA repair dioxygenase AlkB
MSSNYLPRDGRLELTERFYSAKVAAGLFEALSAEIEWESRRIKMFGKEHPLPRLTAWYGEPEASYTYSGIAHVPRAWSASQTPALARIRMDLQEHCGQSFNGVLLNLYRGGADHMSWHADDEKVLGPAPTIASLSLGESRVFELKHRDPDLADPVSLVLSSGSLVVMSGVTQTHWLHRIKKSAKPMGARINLTFRWLESTSPRARSRG